MYFLSIGSEPYPAGEEEVFAAVTGNVVHVIVPNDTGRCTYSPLVDVSRH